MFSYHIVVLDDRSILRPDQLFDVYQQVGEISIEVSDGFI